MTAINRFLTIATNASSQSQQTTDFNMGTFVSGAVARHNAQQAAQDDVSYNPTDTDLTGDGTTDPTALDYITAIGTGLSSVCSALNGSSNNELTNLQKQWKNLDAEIQQIEKNYIDPGKFKETYIQVLDGQIADCGNRISEKLNGCTEEELVEKVRCYNESLEELNNQDTLKNRLCEDTEYSAAESLHEQILSEYNGLSLLPADEESEWAVFDEANGECVFNPEKTQKAKEAELAQLEEEMERQEEIMCQAEEEIQIQIGNEIADAEKNRDEVQGILDEIQPIKLEKSEYEKEKNEIPSIKESYEKKINERTDIEEKIIRLGGKLPTRKPEKTGDEPATPPASAES